MPVELTASTELVRDIGPDRFAEYLAMFNATIVGTRPADPISARIIYTLDTPDAPPSATSVVPTYGTHHDGGTATPYLIRLDWYDHAGHLIHVDNEPPIIPDDEPAAH